VPKQVSLHKAEIAGKHSADLEMPSAIVALLYVAREPKKLSRLFRLPPESRVCAHAARPCCRRSQSLRRACAAGIKMRGRRQFSGSQELQEKANAFCDALAEEPLKLGVNASVNGNCPVDFGPDEMYFHLRTGPCHWGVASFC
jgi:hypothetical protein